MRGFRNSIGGILLGLAFVPLVAASPAPAKEQVLTQDKVSRFLASFEEMRAIAIAQGLKAGADSEAAKNPLGAVLKVIEPGKLKTEAEKVAAAHGFADLKDWAATGRAIAQAYMYITAGPPHRIARDALEQHKEGAVKQLEKLGLLSENSKQKLKQNLDSLEDWLSPEPPPENVAIVTQMKADIGAAVKSGLN